MRTGITRLIFGGISQSWSWIFGGISQSRSWRRRDQTDERKSHQRRQFPRATSLLPPYFASPLLVRHTVKLFLLCFQVLSTCRFQEAVSSQQSCFCTALLFSAAFVDAQLPLSALQFSILDCLDCPAVCSFSAVSSHQSFFCTALLISAAFVDAQLPLAALQFSILDCL